MSTDAEDRGEVGRALAAFRRRVTSTCVECGAGIAGATHRRYCSDACRARAYRRRRRDEVKESQK